MARTRIWPTLPCFSAAQLPVVRNADCCIEAAGTRLPCAAREIRSDDTRASSCLERSPLIKERRAFSSTTVCHAVAEKIFYSLEVQLTRADAGGSSS